MQESIEQKKEIGGNKVFDNIKSLTEMTTKVRKENEQKKNKIY